MNETTVSIRIEYAPVLRAKLECMLDGSILLDTMMLSVGGSHANNYGCFSDSWEEMYCESRSNLLEIVPTQDILVWYGYSTIPDMELKPVSIWNTQFFHKFHIHMHKIRFFEMPTRRHIPVKIIISRVNHSVA